jgi:hypothetical protein
MICKSTKMRAVSLIGAIMAVVLVQSIPAVALGSRTSAGSSVCSNLQSRASAAQSRYKQLKGKVTDSWKTQDTKLKTVAQKEDTSVQNLRQTIDDQQKLNFAKLEDHAVTDQEKQAVAAYEKAITTAQTVRRVAVDAARSTFRTGIAQLIENRRNDATNQANGLSAAIDVAYATAQTSCDGGVSTATIRASLIASLQSAHQQFVDARKNDTAIGAQVKTLAATRNQAIRVANQAFTQSVKAAISQLHQAFHDNSL